MYTLGVNANNCKVMKQTLPDRSGNIKGSPCYKQIQCWLDLRIGNGENLKFHFLKTSSPVLNSTTDVCCHPVFKCFRKQKSGVFLIITGEAFNSLIKVIC